MKIVLAGLWFPHDCYDILHCTIIDYRFVNSYEEDCIQKLISQLKAQDCHQKNFFNRTQVQISSEEIDLMVNNSKTILKKILKRLEKINSYYCNLRNFVQKNNLHEFEVKKKRWMVFRQMMNTIVKQNVTSKVNYQRS